MSDFVVICGQSGAGRTQVGNCLEDLGWFVIDNLPPEFFARVVDLAHGPRGQEPRVAIALGAGENYTELVSAIAALRLTGVHVRIVYLWASTDALVRRYESTKRKHPHGAGRRLEEAIAVENELLTPIRELADLSIDTSHLSQHELKAQIVAMFSDALDDGMEVTVMSFGYKYGIPADVDLVFDCRFLPNPYWHERLRHLSGLDSDVRAYVDSTGEMTTFVGLLKPMLAMLVPAYRNEGKAYLTIALGCTGGRHRSVAMAQATASFLAELGVQSRTFHRDIEKHS